jgi:hypothetical protein
MDQNELRRQLRAQLDEMQPRKWASIAVHTPDALEQLRKLLDDEDSENPTAAAT